MLTIAPYDLAFATPHAKRLQMKGPTVRSPDISTVVGLYVLALQARKGGGTVGLPVCTCTA